MKRTIQKIAVLCGGISNEREVSLRSGANVAKALSELGYETVLVDPAKETLSGDFDFAFIALHGKGGEDGSIQGLLEWLNIPYSGSGICASSIACNKIITKELLSYHHLPTAPFVKLNDPEDLEKITSFPQVIKPAHEGSSIGVSIVDSFEQLRDQFFALSNRYSDLFAENYIQGRELTVSLLDQECFPILELIPKNRFYDYEAKYTKGMTEFILPAPLDMPTRNRIQEVALKACQIIGCRGAVRVDMILDPAGEPSILELNTIPGMTDTSDLPAQALAAGITFTQLVQRMIDVSLSR